MSQPIGAPLRAALMAWALLVVLQLLWHGWLAPSQQEHSTAITAAYALPLLLPLLAWRNLRRALLWVGILSLFYFCHGVSEAWSAPTQRGLALIEIALAVLLIGTLGVSVGHGRPQRDRRP